MFVLAAVVLALPSEHAESSEPTLPILGEFIASSCHRYFARVLCKPFVSIELVDEQGVKITDDTARDRPAGAALSGEPGVRSHGDDPTDAAGGHG